MCICLQQRWTLLLVLFLSKALPHQSRKHFTSGDSNMSDDDSSPVFKRRPLRKAPVAESPDSPSQSRAKFPVPPSPGSTAQQSATLLSPSQPIVAVRQSPVFLNRQSEVGSRWEEPRQRNQVSRRQRKLNNPFIAHQAVEANKAGESVEGSSDSDDDEYYPCPLINNSCFFFACFPTSSLHH